MRTFSGRDLLRIGRRLDRAATEAAEDAAEQTVERRTDAAEQQNHRLRGLLRRRPTA